MRTWGAKLRTFALLTLMATIGGCVADNGKDIVEPSELSLTGRVLSVAEIGVFEGDTVLEWYSFIVEPQGQPGTRIVVVGDRSDCPASGDDSSIYSLRLQKRSMHFAIGRKADEALMSELFIATCERLPIQGEHAPQ